MSLALERVPTSTNAAAASKTIDKCLLISCKTSFPFGSELARSVSGASFPCAARTIDGSAADPAVVWALEPQANAASSHQCTNCS